MNISKAIQHIFPTIVPTSDFIVQDDADGNGPYIARWNYGQPQPTQAQIAAAWDLIKDRPPEKTAEQQTIDKLKSDNEQINLQIIDLFEQLIIKGVL